MHATSNSLLHHFFWFHALLRFHYDSGRVVAADSEHRPNDLASLHPAVVESSKAVAEPEAVCLHASIIGMSFLAEVRCEHQVISRKGCAKV